MLSLIATMIVLFAFGGMTVLADDTEDSGPEIVAQGYCGAEGNGESVSWTLDSNGLLTISGTGEMVNFSSNKYIPWYNYKEVIEKVVIGEGVTSIGNSAFEDCRLLSTITIPDSVTSIGENAFYTCTSLTSITIPDSVTGIGYSAFRNCTSLTSIEIPNSVTSIGNDAFCACTSLATIVIPDSVTSIGNNAFKNCASLASITISDSVTSIGNSAFEGCTSLSSIAIPNSVTSIGNNAFKNCTSLTSITIPNSVTSIGNSAFEECWLLSTITIPNSVTSIGNDAFYNCASLTTITIPDSVTSIGSLAFGGCRSLVSIDIPDSVTSIGPSTFSRCTSLTTITIPNSVTSIGNVAFYNCTSLTTITIPDSVTSIGDFAFEGCTSLASITIPDSVTSIGKGAFGLCENIAEIRLKVNTDVFTTNLTSIFPSTINACIYVPGEYDSAYVSLFASFQNISLYDFNGKVIIAQLGGGTHLYGYSLSLDGSIGVNFYMKLSDEVLNNNDTAYMRFTVNGNVNGKEQIVPVKDLTPNKEGYYIFRCNVVAKEMADEITAQVYLSENNPVGDAYTYSVREYAAYIIEHPEKYSVKAVELVKAMLNYGAAAQTYFGYHTSDLANSVLPTDEQQSSLSAGHLSLYRKGDVLPELVSISLKSTITMKLYFKTEDLEAKNVTSFEYKNETLTATDSGDYTIIVIEGIPAQNFTGIVTINYYVAGNQEAESIKYRPSNYAYSVLNQPTGGVVTEELKGVVSALCSFSRAAYEYNDSGIQPA